MTTSGYTLLDVPLPALQLVHVYPDPDEIGRVYTPALAVVSGGDEWALALDAAVGAGDGAGDGAEAVGAEGAARAAGAAAGAGAAAEVAGERRRWLEEAQADYAAWRVPRAQPGALDYPAIVLHLNEGLRDDGGGRSEAPQAR